MIDRFPDWKIRLRLSVWSMLVVGLVFINGCTPKAENVPAEPKEAPAPIVVDGPEIRQKPAVQQDAPSADPTTPASKPVDEPGPKPEEKPQEKPVAPLEPAPEEKPAAKPASKAGKMTEPPEKPSEPDSSSAETVEEPKPEMVQKPSSGKPTPSDPPPPDQPSIPKKPTLPAHLVEQLHDPLVLMSEAHEESCLLKVGDQMPEFKLRDLQGNEQTLSGLYGQTLTVVVFWSRHQALGREQYRRLGRETSQPFRAAGVNVVAINSGDTLDEIQELTQSADHDVPCLLDAQGTALAAVATSKLPRTYLLDESGKILWLDIEYSRGSRRELENALYFFLLREDS